MRPGQTYAALKREAAARERTFGEIVTLYALERFLARLMQTPHRDDFVLKGGVLLAAYGLRRPTRDIDAQLIDQALDEAHVLAVVQAIADVPADDALVLHVDRAWVEPIRDKDEYGGLRVHLPAHVHTFDVRTFKFPSFQQRAQVVTMRLEDLTPEQRAELEQLGATAADRFEALEPDEVTLARVEDLPPSAARVRDSSTSGSGE
ncbi:nucleotidyl transferase AbiEii/AbiGii toxin family protein [Cellulomonas sp. S1-8]|uniref:nucleotidyl transferase AbiEii/AbiGii toxin family protein n=1 Tax=Cellulomonas sp. S1-8 TaxID=2904790 RepID=UPI0022430484|nr:nucleotidyl transferase AbiEii/AbiGii toxin family protein [Cellulomonas sp. S1-8]UZN04193.1 nucleotidyl transferase AbiEii/AbiGii toxin family protein [Cellulomonas sp. S1-8]